MARRAVVMVSVGGAWECWTPKECMRHRRIWPDVMSFNLALRASAQRWQCARQLLSGAHLGIRPNLLSFDSLLSPELGWNATLVLLGQLASLNLEPNTAHGLQVGEHNSHLHYTKRVPPTHIYAAFMGSFPR